MKHRVLRLWAITAALLFLLPVPTNAGLDTIETDDLRLVYNAGTLTFLSVYASRCFENSMRFHEKLFHYTPKEKVNVYLDDISDFGNAGVFVNPRNTMSVHIAPATYVYETGPSNERINFTMNHEVVHVVALDQAAGADRFFRALFRGKVRETNEHPESILYQNLCVPRRAAPRWYHEGIAVFMETWMAGGLGRAQGPYDEMVFRSMVRDSTRFYDPLGLEAEGTKVDFQAGANSYLYGTRFMSYLAYRYSPESLIQWVSRPPGSKRYFASQFRKVYGLPLAQAWQNWIQWEHAFQQANLDSIRLHRITPSRDLTDYALGSVSRAFYDPPSRTIYAAVDYPGSVAFVGAIPLDGGPIRKLREVKGPAIYFVCSLAYDPDAKKLFYTTDNNDWRDLCDLDPATGKSRVLIKDARIGDLVFDRTTRALWGVRHFNGISTLVKLPYPYNDWNQVYSWSFGNDLYDIDISPDGQSLAGTLAEVSGRQSLRVWRTRSLLEGDTTSTTLHDFGAAAPAGFVFSQDGRSLYGSSYYTGVSNIFQWHFDGDSMSVVTNGETGFFRPLPVARDSLVVFRFTGKGFVPALVDPQPVTDVSAVTFLGAEIAEKHPIVKRWMAPSPVGVNMESLATYAGPYRGIRELGLSSMYPIVEGYKDVTAFGLRLDFSDPLGFTTLDLSGSYSPSGRLDRKERVHLAGAYRHGDWSYQAKWNGASFYDLVGPTKVGRKGYAAGATFTRALLLDPPRHFDFSSTVTGYGGLDILPDAQNVATSPGVDKLVAGSAQLTFTDLRSSLGGVEPERGYKWKMNGTANTVLFQRPGHSAWRTFPMGYAGLDLGAPLPVTHSSLWLRSAAGYSPGDRNEPFANFYFGGFGNNWLDYQDPKRYRDYASFPGVALDEIAGTNFVRSMLDWNLPPIRFGGVGNPAFYASFLKTSVFAGGLLTNLDSTPDRTEAGTIGAQMDVRLTAFVNQKLTLSWGYARAFLKGLRQSDEWMVSLKIL
ncbi:MAG TPA: hypothetical protein VET83_02040 [Candidatus Dormibacteraeota bacterium]|nr:hypothetical protein [Candidatus Dormibacteraeota bacterium]